MHSGKEEGDCEERVIRTGLKARDRKARIATKQIRVVGAHLSAHRCRVLQSKPFLIGFNACEWNRRMYGRMKCFKEEMSQRVAVVCMQEVSRSG